MRTARYIGLVKQGLLIVFVKFKFRVIEISSMYT